MARLLTVLLALPLGAAAVSGDAPAAAIGQLAARLESLRGVFLDARTRVDDRSLQRTVRVKNPVLKMLPSSTLLVLSALIAGLNYRMLAG